MSSNYQRYKGFTPYKMDPKFRVSVPTAWRPGAGGVLFLLFSKEHERPVVKVLSHEAYGEKVSLIQGSDKSPVEKGKLLASHMLEAGEQDIEFADGVFKVAGTDKTVTLIDDDLKTMSRRVSPSWDKTRETVKPFGSYSMAPILHAE